MKSKIVVIGSSGYIGSRFVSLYGEKFSLVCPRINICNAQEVNHVLADAEGSVVIHLAAKTHIDECEHDRRLGKNSETWNVNVEGTKHIVSACKKTGSYLLMFSTECVFDGEEGMYTETDMPKPKNWYGETKYYAEQTVLQSGIPACILRSVYTYGRPDHQHDIIASFLRAMKNKEKVRAVSDQRITFTFVDDVLQAMLHIIDTRSEGIFHYAGRSGISPFEFIRKAASAYGISQKAIEACSLDAYFGKRSALRLRHATLDSTRIGEQFHLPSSDADAAFDRVRYNQ